jgi:hypothetical protein
VSDKNLCGEAAMKGLSAIFLLVVAACIPAPTSAQTPNQSPTAVSKGAVSGMLQRFDFVYSLNPDCTSMGYPSVRIMIPPANGRLFAQQTMDYPNFPATNQRYFCNVRKAPGTLISYMANPDYAGADVPALHGASVGNEFKDRAANSYFLA